MESHALVIWNVSVRGRIPYEDHSAVRDTDQVFPVRAKCHAPDGIDVATKREDVLTTYLSWEASANVMPSGARATPSR